ncbi:hypothetical protein [Neorhodopirellula lusitana]|uniref:hypothetical protein n=1 Tax=Neorhodopirellula lusitana TaxID=445327 RepID=UPI00384FD55F
MAFTFSRCDLTFAQAFDDAHQRTPDTQVSLAQFPHSMCLSLEEVIVKANHWDVRVEIADVDAAHLAELREAALEILQRQSQWTDSETNSEYAVRAVEGPTRITEFAIARNGSVMFDFC